MERYLQSGQGVSDVHLREEPGQRVIDQDRRDDGDHIRSGIMRLFYIRHGARIVIQPRFAEERVPSEPDKEVDEGEDPDGEMMDSVVHKSTTEYPVAASFVASRY
jgi:hypothetical protein